MSLRVISGTAKGRRLQSPEGSAIRPTTDRVREAVFNSLVAYDLPVGAKVLDLFSGTGAFGIEALSRGADSVVFVDSSRTSMKLTKVNVEHCGFRDQSRFVEMSALQYLDSLPNPETERFDLAFLDPPYDFADWSELLRKVPAEFIVAESSSDLAAIVSQISHLEFLRSRPYSSTVVNLIAHRGHNDA